MKMSKQGKIFLSSLEGLAQTKYKDSVGVWTIAVGATASEIPDIAKWPMNKALTITECFDLLDKSIIKYENAINKALKVNVTQAQFDALVSICYNIGTGGASKSTFMKRINANASIGRALAMLHFANESIETTRTDANIAYEEEHTLGFGSTGSVVEAIMMWKKPPEIIGRRTKEANLFATSKYPTNTKISVFPVSPNGNPLYRQAKIINGDDYL